MKGKNDPKTRGRRKRGRLKNSGSDISQLWERPVKDSELRAALKVLLGWGIITLSRVLTSWFLAVSSERYRAKVKEKAHS